MDQTAIQAGAPAKTLETGIQPGVPLNATTDGTQAQPKRAPKNPIVQGLEALASLRLTVVLFLLSMILVFYGTLAQVDYGVWTIVAKYFRSFFVLIPLRVVLCNTVKETAIVVPFPGGWLIGGVMLANLLAAHAIRFKLAWNRAGIILIHAGLIVLMLGEVVTGLFAEEGSMVIHIGQTVSSVITGGTSELAVIRSIDPKQDEVTAVPEARLKSGGVIADDKLPVKFEILQYMVNSELVDFKPGMENPANRGFGRVHVARELPEVAGVANDQRHDAQSAYVRVIGYDGKELGVWLYSVHFDQAQWLKIDGKQYQIQLRYRQTQRDFAFHLNDFKHDKFPGTEKPKDFHSFIRLTDPEAEVERDVEIYMNAPLRYKGETFYQSSWTTDAMGKANGTILQVVRNPGWLMPYISCIIVTLGMLIHFLYRLCRFLKIDSANALGMLSFVFLGFGWFRRTAR